MSRQIFVNTQGGGTTKTRGHWASSQQTNFYASDGTNAASDGTNAASDGDQRGLRWDQGPILVPEGTGSDSGAKDTDDSKDGGSKGCWFQWPQICAKDLVWKWCAVSSPELRHSTSIVCFATRMSIWNSATRRPCVIHFSPRPHKATEAQIVQEVGDRHPS